MSRPASTARPRTRVAPLSDRAARGDHPGPRTPRTSGADGARRRRRSASHPCALAGWDALPEARSPRVRAADGAPCPRSWDGRCVLLQWRTAHDPRIHRSYGADGDQHRRRTASDWPHPETGHALPGGRSRRPFGADGGQRRRRSASHPSAPAEQGDHRDSRSRPWNDGGLAHPGHRIGVRHASPERRRRRKSGADAARCPRRNEIHPFDLWEPDDPSGPGIPRSRAAAADPHHLRTANQWRAPAERGVHRARRSPPTDDADDGHPRIRHESRRPARERGADPTSPDSRCPTAERPASRLRRSASHPTVPPTSVDPLAGNSPPPSAADGVRRPHRNENHPSGPRARVGRPAGRHRSPDRLRSPVDPAVHSRHHVRHRSGGRDETRVMKACWPVYEVGDATPWAAVPQGEVEQESRRARLSAGPSSKSRRRPTLPGGDPQVPSARVGLTSVFGMGTGISPPP